MGTFGKLPNSDFELKLSNSVRSRHGAEAYKNKETTFLPESINSGLKISSATVRSENSGSSFHSEYIPGKNNSYAGSNEFLASQVKTGFHTGIGEAKSSTTSKIFTKILLIFIVGSGILATAIVIFASIKKIDIAWLFENLNELKIPKILETIKKSPSKSKPNANEPSPAAAVDSKKVAEAPSSPQSLTGDHPSPTAAVDPPIIASASLPITTDQFSSEAEINESSDTNSQASPYHYLQNDLPDLPSMERIWTAQEEEAWRRGIASQFRWQRFKTVREVKEKRHLQSRVILWDALKDSGFWIRMQALMGLAEFGVKIESHNIRSAIANVRSSLISNFFKRFYDKNSEGERYVLRYALRVVGPRARYHIIKTLWRSGKEIEDHGLYIIAALEDSDPRVRILASSFVQNMEVEEFAAYQAEYKELKLNPRKNGEKSSSE